MKILMARSSALVTFLFSGLLGLLVLTASARAQSTPPQLGCPVETDVTITVDTQNAAHCNLDASVTVNNDVHFSNTGKLLGATITSLPSSTAFSLTWVPF